MVPIIAKDHNFSNYQGKGICQSAIWSLSHHEFFSACGVGHLFVKSINFRGHDPTHLQEKQRANVMTKAIVHFYKYLM